MKKFESTSEALKRLEHLSELLRNKSCIAFLKKITTEELLLLIVYLSSRVTN